MRRVCRHGLGATGQPADDRRPGRAHRRAAARRCAAGSPATASPGRSGCRVATVATPSRTSPPCSRCCATGTRGLALEAAVRRATAEVAAVALRLRRAPPPAPRADSPAAVEDHPAGAQPCHRGRVLCACRRAAAVRRLPERRLPPRVLRPLGGAGQDRPLGGRLRRPRAPRTAADPGSPIEIALPPEAPLNREWIVVCDAPDLPACLAAVERPGQDGVPSTQRRFEAMWSVDPRAVRHASRVAAALADALPTRAGAAPGSTYSRRSRGPRPPTCAGRPTCSTGWWATSRPRADRRRVRTTSP